MLCYWPQRMFGSWRMSKSKGLLERVDAVCARGSKIHLAAGDAFQRLVCEQARLLASYSRSEILHECGIQKNKMT